MRVVKIKDVPLPNLANARRQSMAASNLGDAFYKREIQQQQDTAGGKDKGKGKEKGKEKGGWPNPLKLFGKVLRACIMFFNNRVANAPWWFVGFLLMGYSGHKGDDDDREQAQPDEHMGSARWVAGMVIYSIGWTINAAVVVAVCILAHRLARRSSAEHPIATKALRCTATAWRLIVAQCSAILTGSTL